MTEGQPPLFDLEEYDRIMREWKDMPEFCHDDLEAYRKLIVNFRNADDVKEFQRVVGQKFGPNMRSIWFPEAEIGTFADKRYADES